MTSGVANLRQQPVTSGFRFPLDLEILIRSGDGLRRQTGRFLAVHDQVNHRAGACLYVHIDRDVVPRIYAELATHYGLGTRRLRMKVNEAIMGAS